MYDYKNSTRQEMLGNRMYQDIVINNRILTKLAHIHRGKPQILKVWGLILCFSIQYNCDTQNIGILAFHLNTQYVFGTDYKPDPT